MGGRGRTDAYIESMRLPSIEQLVRVGRTSAGRFPLVLLSAAIAAAAGVLLPESSLDDDMLTGFLYVATLGIPLFLAIDLVAERRGTSDRARWIAKNLRTVDISQSGEVKHLHFALIGAGDNKGVIGIGFDISGGALVPLGGQHFTQVHRVHRIRDINKAGSQEHADYGVVTPGLGIFPSPVVLRPAHVSQFT